MLKGGCDIGLNQRLQQFQQIKQEHPHQVQLISPDSPPAPQYSTSTIRHPHQQHIQPHQQHIYTPPVTTYTPFNNIYNNHQSPLISSFPKPDIFAISAWSICCHANKTSMIDNSHEASIEVICAKLLFIFHGGLFFYVFDILLALLISFLYLNYENRLSERAVVGVSGLLVFGRGCINDGSKDEQPLGRRSKQSGLIEPK